MVSKDNKQQELQREYMIAQNPAYSTKLLERAKRLLSRSSDLVGRSAELKNISPMPKMKAA